MPKAELNARRAVGLDFVDRLLAGGLPEGSVVLLAGEPGIGKSTLLFQLFGSSDQKVLFVSTEESESQLALRFQAFCQREDAEFYVMSAHELGDILKEADRLGVETLVIDSIQMLSHGGSDRLRGGMSLVREMTDELVTHCKSKGVNLWIVGHVNKDGEIAGPKTLEHLVDSVLLFSKSDDPQVRSLQIQKHRFGPSGEIALLKMDQSGLTEIPEPESFWMHQHSDAVPGCIYCPILLGSRVYCLEVQALCAPTPFAVPRRTVSGFDVQRLHLLLALLEKRLGLEFSRMDVYLNIVGGLKISDPGADLAVAAALVSAFQEKAQASDRVYVGELGLTGEIRSVPGVIERLEAARRVGKKIAIIPKISSGLQGLPPMEIQAFGEISALFRL
jgi:DNA repair protein RadA/Sms